jgi:predicted nucleic acid-binding protein
LAAARAPLLMSPFVLAELDYLVLTRVGAAARAALLAEVARGAYQLAPFANADVPRAEEIVNRHADLAISLADASIVVLAERYGTHDVLTLDERHFRVLTTSDGEPLRLLPSDA